MHLTIQIIFILLCLAVLILAITHFVNINYKKEAPFFLTGNKIIKDILINSNIKEGARIYELGCGNAKFLRALKKRYPEAELIGIEKFPFAYWLAKIQNKISGQNIKILKKDFYKVNLSEADVIYCFLNKHAMAELEKKIYKECKPETLVISYQFSLPNKKHYKLIDKNNKRNRIFFYKT